MIKHILKSFSILLFLCPYSWAEQTLSFDFVGNVYSNGSNYSVVEVWPDTIIDCGGSSSTFDRFTVWLGKDDSGAGNAAFINYTMLLDAVKQGLIVGFDETKFTFIDHDGYATEFGNWIPGTDFSCEYRLNSNENWMRVYYN